MLRMGASRVCSDEVLAEEPLRCDGAGSRATLRRNDSSDKSREIFKLAQSEVRVCVEEQGENGVAR